MEISRNVFCLVSRMTRLQLERLINQSTPTLKFTLPIYLFTHNQMDENKDIIL